MGVRGRGARDITPAGLITPAHPEGRADLVIPMDLGDRADLPELVVRAHLGDRVELLELVVRAHLGDRVELLELVVRAHPAGPAAHPAAPAVDLAEAHPAEAASVADPAEAAGSVADRAAASAVAASAVAASAAVASVAVAAESVVAAAVQAAVVEAAAAADSSLLATGAPSSAGRPPRSRLSARTGGCRLRVAPRLVGVRARSLITVQSGGTRDFSRDLYVTIQDTVSFCRLPIAHIAVIGKPL